MHKPIKDYQLLYDRVIQHTNLNDNSDMSTFELEAEALELEFDLKGTNGLALFTQNTPLKLIF